MRAGRRAPLRRSLDNTSAPPEHAAGLAARRDWPGDTRVACAAYGGRGARAGVGGECLGHQDWALGVLRIGAAAPAAATATPQGPAQARRRRL